MGAPELTTPALDRGVTDRGNLRRGLIPVNVDREDIGAAAEDETASALGCDRIPSFAPADIMTDAEIGRLLAMTQLYTVPGLDGTACLFRMARSLQDNLFAVARRQPKAYRRCLERLLDMHAVLRSRTERPYKLLFDTIPRRALPSEVLDYWPFSEHEQWEDNLKAAKRGRAIVLEPIPAVDKHDRIDADEARAAELEAAMLRLEQTLVGLSLGRTGLAGTPQVRAAIAALSTFTLKHIERQTGVRFDSPFASDKLIKYTECLIYHSVHSVVLDNRGEPTTLGGRLRYPILVPDPGSDMEQHLHSPGLYISVRKYGFGDYRLDDNRITKIIVGGIGALIENHGIGVREPHEFQRRIQEYLDGMGTAYAASMVVPSAFQPAELTVDAISRKLPELATATVPYLVVEIDKQASDLYENWEEVAKSAGVEALKAVITAEAKKLVVSYLVKKIGVKIVPLVNVASTLYDLFTGEEERLRVRNIIGCIMLSVKGTAEDDLHIAAKTIAQILAEKFKDALLDALVGEATKAGGKVLKTRKGRSAHRTSRQPAELPGQGTPARRAEPPPDRPAANPTATGHPSTGAPSTGSRSTDTTSVGNPGTEDTGARPARTPAPPEPAPARQQKQGHQGHEESRKPEPQAKPEAQPEPEPELARVSWLA